MTSDLTLPRSQRMSASSERWPEKRRGTLRALVRLRAVLICVRSHLAVSLAGRSLIHSITSTITLLQLMFNFLLGALSWPAATSNGQQGP